MSESRASDVFLLLEDEAHTAVFEFMQALGYLQAKDSLGLCYGLAHMAKQAMLFNEFHLFIARLKTIQVIWENMAGDVREKLREKSGNELNAIMLEILSRQTGRDVDKQLIIDIRAFFDGVQLYHNILLYPDLVEDAKRLKVQDPELTSLVMPLKVSIHSDNVLYAKNESPIKIVSKFSGAYGSDHLLYYLESLQETVEKENISYPVVLALSNVHHVISISYLPENKIWQFYDSSDKAIETTDYKSLAHAIQDGFNLLDIPNYVDAAILASEIYTFKQNQDEMKNFILKWKQSGKFQQACEGKTWIDHYKFSWLHCAAWISDEESVKKLIADGSVDVNLIDFYECTPLFYAVQSGNLNIVKNLTEINNAVLNVNTPSYNQVTPFQLAAAKGYFDIAVFLIQHGAKVTTENLIRLINNTSNMNDDMKIRLARILVENRQEISTLKEAIEVIEDKNKIPPDLIYPLHFACLNGEIDEVNNLLLTQPDLLCADYYGETALDSVLDAYFYFAIRAHFYEKHESDFAWVVPENHHRCHIIETLLKAGGKTQKFQADANQPLERGVYLRMKIAANMATREGHAEVFRAILECLLPQVSAVSSTCKIAQRLNIRLNNKSNETSLSSSEDRDVYEELNVTDNDNSFNEEASSSFKLI